MAELIILERDMCCMRGYHRVDEEPQNPNPQNHIVLNNLLICYDCETFFGKYDSIPYGVEKT
ncbi:MAG: hypothetical protein Q8R18_05825 [bacterium]|nr:hypothetical protein [bacterium]